MRAAAGGVLVLALSGVQCSDPPREWSIGLYRRESPLELVPAGPNPVLTAADLGIDATFVADPFLLRRDGRLFLFFEAWRRGSGQGDLCWAERDAAGAWRYSGVALDEPFHLSYPFVFEHEGEVFMIPESRSQRDVRLYAARPCPGRFELRRVLLSGERYADTSLVAGRGASTCSRRPTTARSSSSTRALSRARIALIRGAPSFPATTAPRARVATPSSGRDGSCASPSATGRCMACPSGHSK